MRVSFRATDVDKQIVSDLPPDLLRERVRTSSDARTPWAVSVLEVSEAWETVKSLATLTLTLTLATHGGGSGNITLRHAENNKASVRCKRKVIK